MNEYLNEVSTQIESAIRRICYSHFDSNRDEFNVASVNELRIASFRINEDSDIYSLFTTQGVNITLRVILNGQFKITPPVDGIVSKSGTYEYIFTLENFKYNFNARVYEYDEFTLNRPGVDISYL